MNSFAFGPTCACRQVEFKGHTVTPARDAWTRRVADANKADMGQTTQTSFSSVGSRSNWVRLRTLINLRWMAIIGQTLAMIIATQMLDIALRLDLCAVLVGLSVLLNVAATLVQPENTRLSQRGAALTLLFDLAQLAALLYLAGGLTNPFAVMILAQTIISATVLGLHATLALGVATLAVIVFLMRFHIPLHHVDGSPLITSPLLVQGMGAALGVSVVFLSLYTRRVSLEAFSMSQALSATQFALEREQKLTSLGGVVAAAAHELGTPLATIKLAASELANELRDQPELREDAVLIQSQTERCREILASMGESGKDDQHIRFAPFSAVIEEAAGPHLDRGKTVIFRIQGITDRTGAEEEPDIVRQSEIIHGFRNLVQNAVDFAKTTVWVDLDWTKDHLILRVGDDGPGYAPDIIGKIGDPFVSRRQGHGQEEARPGYQGMGLGLFIAKTLLERTGAVLTFANGTGQSGAKGVSNAEVMPPGAIVELIWPRDALVVSRDQSRGPLGENPILSVY